jgi:hypothetical protein
MNQKREVYEWDYDGACSPGNEYSGHNTFSVGIFQWIPKTREGLKRSKVIYRIKGYVSNPDDVYEKAQKLVNMLNNKFKREVHFKREFHPDDDTIRSNKAVIKTLKQIKDQAFGDEGQLTEKDESI